MKQQLHPEKCSLVTCLNVDSLPAVIYPVYHSRSTGLNLAQLALQNRGERASEQTRSSPFSESEGLLRSGRCADPSRLMKWIIPADILQTCAEAAQQI